MKWYWWMLIVIVVLAIIIGVWYYIEANKNLEQLDKYMTELGLFDKNTSLDEIHDYTLQACNESYSKLNSALVGMAGMGLYLSHNYNADYNKDKINEDIALFQNKVCDCINSKGFNIVDIFNPVEDCVVKE